MISIKIDDYEFLTEPQISVLEACKLIGIIIPRFCYHESLSIAGNCRICLVEIENIEKPVASCVTEIENGISIFTNTPFVKKARENVVETLLLSHPLDCPICDQGGECDLQDEVRKYGSNYSKYFFKKKSVEDKYCGPLIKTIMTRCISCTRCVRFSSEIAGEDFYGTLNRGGSTEIGSYVANFFSSELSGNVIDLCPVGALTSAPYAAKGRPWELRVSESIDVTDSLGANIFVNFKETTVVRVFPKSNHLINDNLISDRARFTYDANSINRIIALEIPTKKENGKNIFVGWKNFLEKETEYIKSNKIVFFIDEKLDFESLVALKKINVLYPETTEIYSLYSSKKTNYYLNFNNNLFNLINRIDSCVLFLGTNPKIENAVLNAKIRIKIKNNLIKVYSSGLSFEYNYTNNFLNLSSVYMLKGITGKLKLLSDSITESVFSFVLLGSSLKNKISDLESLKSAIQNMIPNSVVMYLGLKANTEALHFFKFNKINARKFSSSNEVSFFVKNEDSLNVRKTINSKQNKVLWQNTHYSSISKFVNYIIPTSSSFEYEGTYINLEHRPQKTSKVVEISGACKSFFSTLKCFFDLDDIFLTKAYTYIKEQTTIKSKYDLLTNIKENLLISLKLFMFEVSQKFKISKYPINQILKNFYAADVFSKNSLIMLKCIAEKKTCNLVLY